MRLGVLTSSISRNAGGLFSSVRHLHQTLAPEVDTIMLATRDEHSEADSLVWAPLPVQLFETRGLRGLAYAPGMRAALAEWAPDIVHVHGLWQGPSITSVGYHRVTRSPYVISPRGMLDPWALANSAWKKRIAGMCFEKRHLGSATCLHALAKSEADSMRAYGLRNPVAIIPNGVEIPAKLLHRMRGNGQGFKVECLKTEKNSLLFLGRLHPKKGLANALRAWAGKRNAENGMQKMEEWQFVIAGWDQGGHEAELKRLATELGIRWADIRDIEAGLRLSEFRFHPPAISLLFVGPVFGTAKDELLRQADAFILPSFSEGLPMAVLEAWAYGLPVLMTDHCNLPEGFAAGAAFRIGTDVESISEGLQDLFESSVSERQSFGRNGRSLVEKRFTWPCVASQMESVYEWVLGGGSKPDCVIA